MNVQGAGLEPSTFYPEVQRAIDCAAKACSSARDDIRASKRRVVTIHKTASATSMQYYYEFKSAGQLTETITVRSVNLDLTSCHTCAPTIQK